VDEIRLTLTPWLIGGEQAPGIAESREPLEPPPVFAFSEVEAREDEVFLTLRRHRGDG
jgi:riboflavin biosynthesis pyrimidine reductase